MLDVAQVDAARLEDRGLVRPEVLADDADDADIGEEAGSEREVRGGAAEDALPPTERRLERVERDRADDGDGHRSPPYATACGSCTASPAACRRSSALSVRSQVKSWSSRPKWP